MKNEINTFVHDHKLFRHNGLSGMKFKGDEIAELVSKIVR